jgi:hypothetical protein
MKRRRLKKVLFYNYEKENTDKVVAFNMERMEK